MKLPAWPKEARGLQPLRLAQLKCHKLNHAALMERYEFVVGAGRPLPKFDAPPFGTDDWLDKAAAEIVKQSGGTLDGEPSGVQYRDQGLRGREMVIQMPGDGLVLVIRVYAIKNRVYYLSAQGPRLTPEDDPVRPLFASFQVTE